MGAKMKNGCGRLSQNDVISVILSQKGENPSLSSLRMRGMGAQAVLLGVDLDGEKNCHE